SRRGLALLRSADRPGTPCGTGGEPVVDGRPLRDRSAVPPGGGRRLRTAAVHAADASPTLTGHDRCDRCSAAARVRAVLPSALDLVLCEHHARVHESRLREIGALLSPEP